MKVSIITASFNSAKTIGSSIESLLSQDYPDIEHIIIDGNSSDGTISIIKNYKSKNLVLLSETDKGIYDALNKGINLATGDLIGFLHSDDIYENAKVVSTVVNAFEAFRVDSVYGDLVYVSQNNMDHVVRYWQSGLFEPKKLLGGWMPPHPTFFAKAQVYKKYGGFNTDYKIAADYDSILRYLGKNQVSTHYIPEVLIRMRTGGASNRSLKNVIMKTREDLKALRDNQVGGIPTLVLKNIRKVGQFFTSPQ